MAVARSKQYWEKRAKDQCEVLNVKFIGFVQEYVTTRTKVILECYEHGVWKTTRLDHMLAGVSCPECANVKTSQSRRKDDIEHIESFLETGAFDSRYTFCNVGKQKWAVRCSACAEDIYSKAGFCNGVFVAPYACLREGCIPCRCADNVKLTEDQVVFLMNRRMEGSQYSCVSYDKSTRQMTCNCTEHGDWTAHSSNIIRQGTRCPSCAKTGFDPNKAAVFYLLTISNGEDKFMGYGVSNALDKRLRAHRRNLCKRGFKIEDSIFIETTGEQAINIEKFIKQNVPAYPCEIEGFKTESAYIENKDTLLSVLCYI